ncbi:MAG: tetratricopeptide repeat protein [Thiotrichales bacterium]|nr:tetratricopeptide repeat protein [Thiotrichales bacterium]
MKFLSLALPHHRFRLNAPSRLTASLMLALGVLSMQGCASTLDLSQATVTAAAPHSIANDSAVVAPTPKRNMIADHRLTAEQMFLVLQAELQIKRGQGQQAFDLYYQLADETREAELARRAFSVAMSTFDTQSIAQAAALWRSVEPKEPAVWRASFVMSLRNGDVKAAIKQWQTYAELSDEGLQQDILAAAQRLNSPMIDRVDAAVDFMQRLVKLYPDQWSAYLGLGMMQMRQAQFENALASFNRVLAFEGFEQKEEVYDLIAKLYLQTGDFEQGIAQLQRYVEQDPQNIFLQERLARLEVQAGFAQQAQQRYAAIVDRNPQQHSARFALALLQLEANQNQEAIALLQPLLEVPAYRDVTYYYLGYAEQNLQRLDAALDYYQQVAGTNYRTDALLRSAEIYYSQGQLERALSLLDEVDISNAESLQKVFLARAIFYRFEREYGKAVEVLQELLALNPDNQKALLEQANLYYQLEKFEQYVANMQRLLELDGDNVDALNGLGYFYAERNIQLEDAKRLIERALQLEPNNFFILDSMGWLYFQMEDYPRALDFLQRAYAIEEDRVVIEHLIRVYWALGRKAEAESFWQTYRQGDEELGADLTLEDWIRAQSL